MTRWYRKEDVEAGVMAVETTITVADIGDDVVPVDRRTLHRILFEAGYLPEGDTDAAQPS